MFKASIALVLVAFSALAYGWIAGNDAVLYGSIGASALAGLALLASTRSDPGSSHQPLEYRDEPAPRPSRPRPDRSERKAKKRRGDVVTSEELTRQLDVSGESQEFFDEQDEPPLRQRPTRRPVGRAPEEPDWAEPEQTAYSGGAQFDGPAYPDDEYPDEQDEDLEEYVESPERVPVQPAAADDFRSRLAAVLGTSEEQEPTPSAGPPPRARRVDPGPVEDSAPAPRSRRAPRSSQPADEPVSAPAPRSRRVDRVEPEDEPPPRPPRRGRKKADPDFAPVSDAGSDEDARSDEAPPPLRSAGGARVTQPGGGFARPDAPEGITPYRPRRPGAPIGAGTPSGEVADAQSPGRRGPAEDSPAPVRRRTSPAERTAAKKVRSGGYKSSTGETGPAVTRVTGESGSKASPPRRGRPPKPNP